MSLFVNTWWGREEGDGKIPLVIVNYIMVVNLIMVVIQSDCNMKRVIFKAR